MSFWTRTTQQDGDDTYSVYTTADGYRVVRAPRGWIVFGPGIAWPSGVPTDIRVANLAEARATIEHYREKEQA